MNETTVTDVIERLDYRCAVFSVVDADDVAILLKAYRDACAERDELRLALRGRTAQLNAVPVEAIIAYRANSDESEGLIRNGDHEAFADFAEAMRTLDAWLETQVTP